jgi:uncharacterized membrane protein
MIERLIPILTLLAALGSGAMAGLFFAFSTSVMAALGRLPPPQGIAAMQSINVTILNPLFFAVFFGTALVCLVLAFAAASAGSGTARLLLLAGCGLYLVGSIVVTMVFNVPLNNALAAAAPDSAAGATLWTRYLSVWTAWNHARGLACLAAAACFTWALR